MQELLSNVVMRSGLLPDACLLQCFQSLFYGFPFNSSGTRGDIQNKRGNAMIILVAGVNMELSWLTDLIQMSIKPQIQLSVCQDLILQHHGKMLLPDLKPLHVLCSCWLITTDTECFLYIQDILIHTRKSIYQSIFL